jgi:hypothetical protein
VRVVFGRVFSSVFLLCERLNKFSPSSRNEESQLLISVGKKNDTRNKSLLFFLLRLVWKTYFWDFYVFKRN